MYFDGEPVRDVSPLPLWFMASCYRFFGTNEFSARLPFVLFAALTYFLTYLIGISSETPHQADSGWINRARSIGLLSAILLAASPIFGKAAPHVSISMPQAFFGALALLGWLSISECRSGLLLWGLGVAGAVFVAGADGAAIVVSAVIAWAVAGRGRSVGGAWFFLVSAFGLALGGVWLLLNAPPSGGHFFTNPLWSALAGLVRPRPGAAAGMFGQIKDIWIGNLPWSIVAAAAFIRVIFFRSKEKGVQSVDGMLALFIAILFLLIAFTGTGRTDRLLVILPAVAVLSARELSRWITAYGNSSLDRLWAFNQAMVSLFCLLMLLLLATPLRLHRADVDPIRDIAVMAKQLSPGDERIGNFKQPYRTQAARFLFYGGKSLEEPLNEPEGVGRVLERDPSRIFLSSLEDFTMLQESRGVGFDLRILYRAGPLVLFGSEPGAE
jgi:4-amino-4-deoxy-L-arabinose transferase-like glycosyltransferase